jgi:hypothetical protein
MVDPLALKQAVAEVQSGIPWAMPHKQVFRASKQATEEFYLHQDPSDPVVIPPAGALDRVPYEGLLGGGIVVTRRVWYDATGGIPVAFRGWGKEDQAFALIMQTLLGICARVQADLLHLYHTPQIGRHSTPGANMPLLRKLGAAAQRGPDALVLSVSTLRLARGEARQEWRDRLKKHRATTRAPAIPVRASAIPVRKRAP